MGRIGTWALLIAAVPLALFAGVNAFLGVVMLSKSRELGVAAAAIAVVAVAGFLAYRAARRLSVSGRVRLWLPAAVSIGAFALGASIAWTLILEPAPASTPATGGAQFWDLPTGSRIAFQHTAASGTPHSTPVILVHGGPGSPDRDAASLASVLADTGFDVYSYHQLGAGLSSREDAVEDYTVARHIADLEAIRAAIGAERVMLVGASWGAQLITNYLAAHPDRVDRVVISSPAAIWAPAFTDVTRLAEGGRENQQTVIGRFPRFALAHVLAGAIGPQAASALLPDDQVDGVFETMVQDLDMGAGCPGRSPEQDVESDQEGKGFGFWVNAMTTRDTRNVGDPRPVLRDLTTPVLVMRAECDYIAWDVTREYRDLMPNAVLVAVGDARHVVSADQPEIYRELVRAFLLDEELPAEPYTGATEPW